MSDEIRTAINFDNVRTVNHALHQIKEYLDMAIMPLCLQRLEVLHYKPPQGQTQTAPTLAVVQMLCKADMFGIIGEAVLNTIQDKT